MSVDSNHFKKVPLAEITSPEKAGPLWTYKDHWWAVTEDGCVLIYIHRRSNSPQCNTNREIVDRYLNYPEPTTPKLLPWAYLKFNLSDYT
jgi:hypothetical protein